MILYLSNLLDLLCIMICIPFFIILVVMYGIAFLVAIDNDKPIYMKLVYILMLFSVLLCSHILNSTVNDMFYSLYIINKEGFT